VGYYYNRRTSLQDAPSYNPANSQLINEPSSPEFSDPPPPPPETLELPLESENFESELEPELKNPEQDFEYMSKNEKANYMRQYPEPAEKRMWEIINSSIAPNFPKHPFYSQYVYHGYILDFYCPTLSLAIEVDGGSHNNRVGDDWERDTNLANRGIQVLRATNDQVFINSEAIANSLRKIIQDKDEQIESEKRYSAMQNKRAERYRRKY
jgi:very-short-patch-repair endonuclease